jgi:hypothetical protein
MAASSSSRRRPLTPPTDGEDVPHPLPVREEGREDLEYDGF